MWPKRDKQQQSNYSVGGVLLAIVLATSAFLIFTQRQFLADSLTVMQYQPSSEIASLADRSGMNKSGQFHFYASTPELLEADRFNKHCANYEPESAILGCYRGGVIYVYNIQDDRLDGIKEVTAAHEMLHAVYARLSDKQKDEINDLVDQAYSRLKNDKLASRLELYDRSQPGTRYVELHAIIGTEYRDVGPELEGHYSEFFDDRLATVGLYESYIEQFSAREQQALEISQELNQLADEIESESVKYNRDVNSLSTDINSFNARAGRVGSVEERNALLRERSLLVGRTSELESSRIRIDDMITRYNLLVEEHNEIASEIVDLYESLDSNLLPAPAV